MLKCLHSDFFDLVDCELILGIGLMKLFLSQHYYMQISDRLYKM